VKFAGTGRHGEVPEQPGDDAPGRLLRPLPALFTTFSNALTRPR
jgi:hypothetical protein